MPSHGRRRRRRASRRRASSGGHRADRRAATIGTRAHAARAPGRRRSRSSTTLRGSRRSRGARGGGGLARAETPAGRCSASSPACLGCRRGDAPGAAPRDQRRRPEQDPDGRPARRVRRHGLRRPPDLHPERERRDGLAPRQQPEDRRADRTRSVGCVRIRGPGGPPRSPPDDDRRAPDPQGLAKDGGWTTPRRATT